LVQFGADFRALAPLLSSSPYFVSSLYSDLTSLAEGNIYVLSVTQRDPVAMHLTNFSLFAQDLWKVTPRFTLNYGLHWEYNPAPSADADTPLFASVNLQNSAIQYAAQGMKLWQTGPGNFAPRLGMAFRLAPGLLLRAAAGTYYDLGFG
jgi:outer membrane receptor protein involved in Fe transport